MNRTTRFILIFAGFLALVVFRSLAQGWFYDPLMEYFKNDFLNRSMPEVEFSIYFFHMLLRYTFNALISLWIIHLVFLKRAVFHFCVKFYIIAFLLFGFTVFMILNYALDSNYLILFYIRRFLIHPVFLLILIPAFYIHKGLDKKLKK